MKWILSFILLLSLECVPFAWTRLLHAESPHAEQPQTMKCGRCGKTVPRAQACNQCGWKPPSPRPGPRLTSTVLFDELPPSATIKVNGAALRTREYRAAIRRGSSLAVRYTVEAFGYQSHNGSLTLRAGSRERVAVKLAKLVSLQVALEPPDATLEVQGKRVRPGTHQVALPSDGLVGVYATAPGYSEYREVLSLSDRAPGENVSLSVKLKRGVVVRFEVEPSYATVEVGGKVLDDKELKLDIEPGQTKTVEARVTCEGFKPQTITIRATEGETLQPIVVRLEPASVQHAKLRFAGSPHDAVINVDGNAVDGKEHIVSVDTEKEVTVTVHRPGYQTWKRTLRIGVGHDETLEYSLVPLPVVRSELLAVSHKKAITDMAWSPTKPLLMSASEDATVRIWGDSGRSLIELKKHGSSVSGGAWSSDGQRLFSVAEDSKLNAWTQEGSHVSEWGLMTPLTSVAASSRGMIASGGQDGTIVFWSDKGNIVAREHHNEAIRRLAWSRDGSVLASFSEDGVVRLWSDTPRLVAQRQVRLAGLVLLKWHPTGSFVLVAGNGNVLQVSLDGEVSELFATSAKATAAALTDDGSLIAIAQEGGQVRVYSLSGEELWSVAPPVAGCKVTGLAWHKTSLLAIGLGDGKLAFARASLFGR